MEPDLKQRLVGAIVLVSVAVIFVPMVLKGPDEARHGIGATNVPEPPPVEAPAPEPSTPEGERASQAGSQSDAAGTGGSEPASGQTDTASSNAELDVTEWVVQVGSFEAEANAQRLRDRLREANFAAFIETGEADGERVWRVQVGPELSKESAQALEQRLREDADVANGIVKTRS